MVYVACLSLSLDREHWCRRAHSETNKYRYATAKSPLVYLGIGK